MFKVTYDDKQSYINFLNSYDIFIGNCFLLANNKPLRGMFLRQNILSLGVCGLVHLKPLPKSQEPPKQMH